MPRKRISRRAFQQKARKLHPDVNKAPDAEERFKEISEAYAVLSDEQKRARYDAMRSGNPFAGGAASPYAVARVVTLEAMVRPLAAASPSAVRGHSKPAGVAEARRTIPRRGRTWLWMLSSQPTR